MAESAPVSSWPLPHDRDPVITLLRKLLDVTLGRTLVQIILKAYSNIIPQRVLYVVHCRLSLHPFFFIYIYPV
jgi:hypothetical protein